MIESAHFNQFKDMARVVPGMSIDLNEALRTGVVKDTGMEVEYNGIEDPRSIRGRVEDNFQAIDERNAVVGRALQKSKSAVQTATNNSDLPE